MWVIIAGVVVIGLVIASVTGGILGHVLALIVWTTAIWLCIRPARALTASAARMWARIGVAVFACLAVYAGSLAIVGTVDKAGYTNGSSAVGSDAARFCELEVTWTTGSSMTIAEPLDTALSSCDDLASQVTGDSGGYFTAVSGGSLASMPAGICTDEGVTLIRASATTVVACDGLEQNINYLLAPRKGASATANSGNQSAASGNTPVCYLTITGAETVYVAISGANSSDCQRLWVQVQQVARGGTVSPDYSARPFPAGSGAVCMGTIDGDPATVVAPNGDDGGMCSALGFSSVPLQAPTPTEDPDPDARTDCRNWSGNGLTSRPGRACRRGDPN